MLMNFLKKYSSSQTVIKRLAYAFATSTPLASLEIDQELRSLNPLMDVVRCSWAIETKA